MIAKKSAGFSLIEILIAVAIITLMMVTIGPRVMDYFARAKKGAAKTQLFQVKDALLQYNMDIGRFPNTREGLQALMENGKSSDKWQGPYLSKEPLDPWDQPYVYSSPPATFKQYRRFEVYSYGENGEAAPQNEWIHSGE